MSGTRVAISGITGFLGSQITADLLRRGYTVHGTLRKNKPEKIAHLPTDTPGTLNVFEADLLKPDSFDEATAGCKYALHVASPFIINVKDPQKDLVDPAVQGTLSFLGSCLKNGVEKVVVTSSVVAVADAGSNGARLDESDWNDHSSLKFLPYFYSKAQAEREAWKFAEQHGLKIVTINPAMIFGPSMVNSVNESANTAKQFVDGSLPGIIDIAFPVVDVRDVSEAHIRAMESDSATGRYICCPADHLVHSRDMARLWKELGVKPVSLNLENSIITSLIRILAPLTGSGGQYAKTHIGNPAIFNSEKIIKDLDMKFIPAEEAVTETMKDLISRGLVKKAETSS